MEKKTSDLPFPATKYYLHITPKRLAKRKWLICPVGSRINSLLGITTNSAVGNFIVWIGHHTAISSSTFKTRKTTSKLTQSDSKDVFLKYQLYFLNTFPSPSETLRSKIRISVFVKPLIGKIKSCQNAKWDE